MIDKTTSSGFIFSGSTSDRSTYLLAPIQPDLSKRAASAALYSLSDKLKILTESPLDRHSTEFIENLAAAIYDTARAHIVTNRLQAAKIELDKAAGLIRRMADSNPDRYIQALKQCDQCETAIGESQFTQANLFAHYQVAAATYMQQLREGSESAVGRLADAIRGSISTLNAFGDNRATANELAGTINALYDEGREFDEELLQLAISLGETLITINSSRDKGEKLLSGMKTKAIAMNLPDYATRIDEIIESADAQPSITDLWRNIFSGN